MELDKTFEQYQADLQSAQESGNDLQTWKPSLWDRRCRESSAGPESAAPKIALRHAIGNHPGPKSGIGVRLELGAPGKPREDQV